MHQIRHLTLNIILTLNIKPRIEFKLNWADILCIPSNGYSIQWTYYAQGNVQYLTINLYVIHYLDTILQGILVHSILLVHVAVMFICN